MGSPAPAQLRARRALATALLVACLAVACGLAAVARAGGPPVAAPAAPAPGGAPAPLPDGLPVPTPLSQPVRLSLPGPEATPTAGPAQAAPLLCASNIYDPRNPLPGRTVRFRTPIEINPNGMQVVLEAIERCQTLTGGLVTFRIVDHDPAVGVIVIPGDAARRDGSPGCGNVTSERDANSGHRFVVDAEGALAASVYIHLGSAVCDPRRGARPSGVAEHELGHALGLGEHFPGFAGDEGLTQEAAAVLALLYSLPPGSETSSLCAGR